MKKILRKIALALSVIMIASAPNVYANSIELNDDVYYMEEYHDYNLEDLILTDKEIEMANNYVQEQRDLGNKIRKKRNSEILKLGYIGSLSIPGVGEVVLTATGAVIVAGVVVSSGNWLFKKITAYVKESTVKRYYSAKKSGQITMLHSTQYGGSLPVKGKPNSSKDLRDNKGLKQRRYYDKNGDADLDIDYRHGGNGKEPFPHKHKWTNGKRGTWFK